MRIKVFDRGHDENSFWWVDLITICGLTYLLGRHPEGSRRLFRWGLFYNATLSTLYFLPAPNKGLSIQVEAV